jgi:hypothetical protein
VDGRDKVAPSRADDRRRITVRQRGEAGVGYLVRQTACIGGGTTQMARNVISERLLGMPREARADDGPFRDVPRGRRA